MTIDVPTRNTAPRWWNGAKCATADPDLFFSDNPRKQRAAVAICQTCPVIVACREAGAGETVGVWGGVVRGKR